MPALAPSFLRVALSTAVAICALGPMVVGGSALTLIRSDGPAAAPTGQSYFFNAGDQIDFKAPVRKGSKTIVSFGNDTSTGLEFEVIDPSGRLIKPRMVEPTSTLGNRGVTALPVGDDGYAVELNRVTPGNWAVRVKYPRDARSRTRVDIGWSTMEDRNLNPITTWTVRLTGPRKISIDGSASWDPEKTALSFEWSFGDGTKGSGVYASHVYKKSGAYTVTGTVSDADGAAVTLSKEVVVEDDLKSTPIASLSARVTKKKPRAARIVVKCSRAAVKQCEVGIEGRPRAARAKSPRRWGVILAPGRSRAFTLPLPKTQRGTYEVMMRARDRAQRAGGATTATRILRWR